MKETSYIRAINLMIEDLQTKHHEIRAQSIQQDCDKELDGVKEQLLNYLRFLRKTL